MEAAVTMAKQVCLTHFGPFLSRHLEGPAVCESSLSASAKQEAEQIADLIYKMPKVAGQAQEIMSSILYTLPLQLIAYQTASLLGKNVDRPRNLAKSVTVE